MTKGQRATIERELGNYIQNMKEAAEDVASMCYANLGVDYTRPSVKSSGGNGTEKRVISVISSTEWKWRWCVVYQRTYDKFRWSGKEELMRKRFIEHRHWRRICFELHLTPSTYYYQLDEILLTAYMWAKEIGLMG